MAEYPWGTPIDDHLNQHAEEPTWSEADRTPPDRTATMWRHGLFRVSHYHMGGCLVLYVSSTVCSFYDGTDLTEMLNRARDEVSGLPEGQPILAQMKLAFGSLLGPNRTNDGIRK